MPNAYGIIAPPPVPVGRSYRSSRSVAPMTPLDTSVQSARLRHLRPSAPLVQSRHPHLLAPWLPFAALISFAAGPIRSSRANTALAFFFLIMFARPVFPFIFVLVLLECSFERVMSL